MASAVAANAIGAWFAIVLGLAVGGGILWFAFSLLRRISQLESEAEAPAASPASGQSDTDSASEEGQQKRPGRADDGVG